MTTKAKLSDMQAMSQTELKTMLELTDDDTMLMDLYTHEQQKAYNKHLTETMAKKLGDSEEFLSMDDWLAMRCEFHVLFLRVCEQGDWLDQVKEYVEKRP